ncbi:MAG: acetyltransferase [Chloroflexi bacterium]|nr:acetyltransferase [Chloroflexota bacterium]
MRLRPVIVYGAGGHAKVVIDILEVAGQHTILGLIDDDPYKIGTFFCGYKVLGDMRTLQDWQADPPAIILAIGDNHIRSRLAGRLTRFPFTTAVHPTATVARKVSVGEGTVMMAHAVINPGAVIGNHVIVNTGAIVDHDCIIGDFVHLSPGVKLGGHVTIGSKAHVGIGATVINDVSIGAGSIIGAGAAVVEDVPDGVLAIGVPAGVIKRVEPIP